VAGKNRIRLLSINRLLKKSFFSRPVHGLTRAKYYPQASLGANRSVFERSNNLSSSRSSISTFYIPLFISNDKAHLPLWSALLGYYACFAL